MKKLFTLLLTIGFIFVSCDIFTNNANESEITSELNGYAMFNNSNDHSNISIKIKSNNSVVKSTTTDSSGLYSVDGLVEGNYTITASSINSKEKTVNTSVLIESRNTTASDLELTAIGHISGRITIDDSASGNLGVLVFVAGTSYVAMTNDSGDFVISEVPVGSDYSVVISKDGYMIVWDIVDVTTGNITNLNNYNLLSSDFVGNTGDSAYDIWLSLGNEGTEQDFIDSLQGEDGVNGTDGINGVDGFSLIWKGSLETHPENPESNWAYYNSIDGISYIYDGIEWSIFIMDGVDGTDGDNGISIVWKGSLDTAPENPELNWAYYNSVVGISYIYDGSEWTVLGMDGLDGENGLDGQDGLSITWKGTLENHPINPEENWAYYNSVDGKSYIYDGTSWMILAQDGVDCTSGIPRDGLVAEYLFDGDANDTSENSNNGTIYGAALTTDRHGNTNSAYSFDGIDDYITIDNVSNIGAMNESYTVNAWIKIEEYPSSGNVYYILGDYWGSSDQTFSSNLTISENTNQITFAKRLNGNVYSVSNDIETTLNDWVFISVVSSLSGQLNLYINGTLEDSQEFDISNTYIENPVWRIGQNNFSNSYYKGAVDNIRIYDRALSNNEISSLYEESLNDISTEYITVLTPNGDENWEKGTTQHITWDDNISENVMIQLWRGDVLETNISTDTESDGSFTWPMTTGYPVSSEYKIKISSVTDSTITDSSDNVFTINDPVDTTGLYSIDTLNMNFVTILESGSSATFDMGSNTGESDESPVHSVTLTRGYKMSITEITQKQYEDIMYAESWGYNGYGTGDNYPAYYVTWYEAAEFCNKLSIKDGLDPAYYSDSSFTSQYTESDGNSIFWKESSTGYRLPTEAEWEYAARGGAESNGYTYSGSDTIGDVAWYESNSAGTSHEVGTKQANELGLYDMSGNLFEWCWDWYTSSYYSSSPPEDPEGNSSGSSRVLRGGFWLNDAIYCRLASRVYDSPDRSFRGIGFRVVSPVH